MWAERPRAHDRPPRTTATAGGSNRSLPFTVLSSLLRYGRRPLFLLLLLALCLYVLYSQLLSSLDSSTLAYSVELTRLTSQLQSAAQQEYDPLAAVTFILTASTTPAALLASRKGRSTLTILQAAGVPESRIVVLPVSNASSSSSGSSGVTSYPAAALDDCFAASEAVEFCVVIPHFLRVSDDLPAFFLQASRVYRLDAAIFLVSSSPPFPYRAFSRDPASASPAGIELRYLHAAQLHSSHTAFMVSAKIHREVRTMLGRGGSQWLSTLNALMAGRSVLLPAVARTVSLLLPEHAVRALRLSAAPHDAPSPELSSLTAAGFAFRLHSLLPSSLRLTVLEEAHAYSGQTLSHVVPAASDWDPVWHALLQRVFGVALQAADCDGCYSHYPDGAPATAPGVWKGMVTLRYVGNSVILVAPYSPFYASLPSSSSSLSSVASGLQLVGCSLQRDSFPYAVFPTVLTPTSCLASCTLRSYQYAALLDGDACRCSIQFHQQPALARPVSACNLRCSDAAHGCGGDDGSVSVYEVRGELWRRWKDERADVWYVRGREGENCSRACERSGKGARRCEEELQPLLGTSCGVMRAVGWRSGDCVDSAQKEDGSAEMRRLHVTSAPYLLNTGVLGGVVLGAGRHFDCAATPMPDTSRACVCT